ncbi:MAG: hypothetical protein EOO39_32020, partial [Cytophagaceae bacterium]
MPAVLVHPLGEDSPGSLSERFANSLAILAGLPVPTPAPVPTPTPSPSPTPVPVPSPLPGVNFTATYEYDSVEKLFSVRATISPSSHPVTMKLEQQNNEAITGYGFNESEVTSGQVVLGESDVALNPGSRVWFFDGGNGKTGITNPAIRLTFRDTITSQQIVRSLTLTTSGTIVSGGWDGTVPVP